MALIIAILAGIWIINWPVPRWWWVDTKWWPPLPKPGDPRPEEAEILGPRPEPWMLINGLVAGLGGAIAWIVLGEEAGRDGSLLAPVVIGALGGAASAWAVNSIRGLAGSRSR